MYNAEKNYLSDTPCSPQQKEHLEFADSLAFQIIRKYSVDEQRECINQIRGRILEDIEKRMEESKINLEYLQGEYTKIRKQSE